MINLRRKVATSELFNTRIFLVLILISCIFLFLSLALLLANYSQLPDEIPLFYSQKNQILASKKILFLAPGIIFSILVVNLSLAKIFFSKWLFLAAVLTITQTLIAFLILWTESKIILLF